MTEQEAIEILEKPSVHIKPVHKTENGMDFLSYSADLVEAFEMSIMALEKQIAKKLHNYYCPICRYYFEDGESHKYCPECGQRLEE
jgi:rubrerythrin